MFILHVKLTNYIKERRNKNPQLLLKLFLFILIQVLTMTGSENKYNSGRSKRDINSPESEIVRSVIQN